MNQESIKPQSNPELEQDITNFIYSIMLEYGKIPTGLLIAKEQLATLLGFTPTDPTEGVEVDYFKEPKDNPDNLSRSTIFVGWDEEATTTEWFFSTDPLEDIVE